MEVRVKQHIPLELLRLSQEITFKSWQAQEWAIGDHLCEHYICRTNYAVDRFSVLHKARCKKHQAVLEAIAISLFHSSLCSEDISILSVYWGSLMGIRRVEGGGYLLSTFLFIYLFIYFLDFTISIDSGYCDWKNAARNSLFSVISF